MANPTTTPETLAQVLTDDVLAEADKQRFVGEQRFHAGMKGQLYGASERRHLSHAGWNSARRVILAALTPYLEAREQAIRADERRKDGVHYDAESKTFVGRATIYSAGRSESEAREALASAIRLTADYWPNGDPR